MGTLLRHTIRSSDSNKGQVAIIIITVMVVTAMLFVALTMFDVFYNINMNENDRVAQGADMLLGSNTDSMEFFSQSRLERCLEEGDIKNYYTFSKFSSILKTDEVSRVVLVEATDMSKYLTEHTLKYIDEFNEKTPNPDVYYPESGAYNNVIVGETFAKNADIKVGDLIEIYLPTHNKYTQLLVKYIAKNEGIFGSNADINVLVDYEAVGASGQLTAAYINFTSPNLYDKYEKIFQEEFPSVDVGEGNRESDVMDIVRNNTSLLIIGLIFLVAMMMIILFTAYLIIARNRMNEMVVFKSAGATPTQITFIMLLEVVFYAVIGGVMGLALGRALMGIAVYKILPLVHNAINYAIWKYIVAFICAILVTICAALGPIIKVSRKSVRELTSSSQKVAKPVNVWVFVAITIALVGTTIGYKFMSGTAVLVMSVVLLIIMIAWVYCAIYYTIKGVSFLMKKIKPAGAFSLAGRTVERNGAMHTVTILLAVVIAFSFLVVEVVDLVKAATVPFRSRYDAEYTVLLNQEPSDKGYDGVNEYIKGIDGISDSGYFNSKDFIMPGTEDDEWTIYGVSDYPTLAHCSSGGLSEGFESEWNNTPNALVVSQDMLLRYRWKVGDTIRTKVDSLDFQYEEVEFKIVGVDYSVTEYDRIAYAKHSAIEKYSGYSIYLIQKADDVDVNDAFISLRNGVEALKYKNCYALTFDEWAYATTKNLSGIGLLLTFLQIAVYVVGFMGLVNLSIVTVFDRKREINLYKLSGMSSKDYMAFAFGEGVIVALSGGIIGLIIGFIMNQLLPNMGSIVDKFLAYQIFPLSVLVIFAIAFALFVLLWQLIAVANRKSKLSSFNERTM